MLKQRTSRKARICWESIKKLQGAHAGRRSSKSYAILKDDGELATKPDEIRDRWQQHFERVLNISSTYQEEVVSKMPQLPMLVGLDDLPTAEELDTALAKLQKRKAAGMTEISPQMILTGPMELKQQLLQLVQKVWSEAAVVDDWKNAAILPIPKKGNLKVCDNWRGISLLDVVGKVFGRIIHSRLQNAAEDILPDSQCGFRQGRGCTDMIFVARQLVEKTLEHDYSLYILFVDLRKAYDSVPRNALWKVLQKYGIPPTMLNIIKSFSQWDASFYQSDIILILIGKF